MSKQQRDALVAILRQGGVDLGADVATMRAALDALMANIPIAADVDHEPVTIGGVDAIDVTMRGVDAASTILYFHGGVYVIGSAAQTVPLVSDLARRAHAKAVTVEYRLAPEHPYPAAVDDARAAYEGLLAQGVDPGRIALAGESAGGGLAVATLLALRDAGVPLPSCAFLMSPYADLTLAGETMLERAASDPILTPEGLRLHVADYVGHADASDPLISPVFADLNGLPPLLIQVGSNEILLSDALRLADRAALADVPVTLDVTPGVPHVFQGFAAMLDEGNAALNHAASFVRTHLGAETVNDERDMSDPLDWNAQTIAEFHANEGKVGGNFEGAPMVLVHHRGRKSGREHVSPLMYLPHDTDQDIIFVFATKGGAPDNPDWYYNLVAADDSQIERGTETYNVTVREVTGAERDRIYAEQTRRYPGFAEYARLTEGVRTIPVLELTRA